MKISIVSPVYMARNILERLTGEIEQSMSAAGCQYETILVNDGSPDGSWQEIERLCQKDERIKGVNLSRNFGQHQAIAAGLSVASGQWVVVMDCDLQDRPQEIPRLLNKAMEGYDIVLASRTHRQDSWAKRLSSRAYHYMLQKISDLHTNPSVGNFGIYSRRVIEQYNNMPELSKQFAAQIKYLGFPTATIPVEHSARHEGKTSYNLHKLTSLAIHSIVANSNKPLRWAVEIGLLMSAISFALAIYNIAAKICGIITVPGYTSTVFSIWFVGGIILMMLGIIGLYIGKIFHQAKGRPPFIIMDRKNI